MTCRSFLSTVISTSSALPSRSSTASATTIITCKYLNNYAPFLPRFYSLKPSLFNKPKPKYISSTSNYLSPNTNLSSNDKDQSQTDQIDPNTLQWSTFFKLKKQLRNWERLGALTLGVTSFVGGSIYFGTVADFDPIEPVFGIDPNIAYGGASFLVGLAGLLTGLQGKPPYTIVA